MVYLDTGCLVKLYYPEPDSHLVIERTVGESIVFTPLHFLETTTALALKVFRNEATSEQSDQALALLREDISHGKLIEVDSPALESLYEAAQIARRHAAHTGCRAMDILHCAWAKNLVISGFLSTDHRQKALARLIGLRILDL